MSANAVTELHSIFEIFAYTASDKSKPSPNQHFTLLVHCIAGSTGVSRAEAMLQRHRAFAIVVPAYPVRMMTLSPSTVWDYLREQVYDIAEPLVFSKEDSCSIRKRGHIYKLSKTKTVPRNKTAIVRKAFSGYIWVGEVSLYCDCAARVIRVVDVLKDTVLSMDIINKYGNTFRQIITLSRGVHSKHNALGRILRARAVTCKPCVRVYKDLCTMNTDYAETGSTTYFAHLYVSGYVAGIWDGRTWKCPTCDACCSSWGSLMKHYKLPLRAQTSKFTMLPPQP